MAVTIQDVAKLAGVTNGTVSRAFNGYSDILPETKQRIVEAADKLGYVPNVSARSLAAKRPPNIGLIIYGLLENNRKDNMMYQQLQGVLTYTTEHHLELALYSSDSMTQRRESYTEFCRQHNISGTIISGVTDDDVYFKELIRSDIPCVTLDVPVSTPKSGWISIDSRAAAREVIERLLGMGHRDLMIVAGKKNTAVNTVRMRGVQDALDAAGLQIAGRDYIFCDFSEDLACRGMRGRIKSGEKLPTAVFCFSDIMALGVMRALREAGIRVPEDVSVIGFDDQHLCEVTVPTLSSVHQDMRVNGYEAAAMLHGLMEGTGEGGHRLMPHRIVLRDSVRAI